MMPWSSVINGTIGVKTIPKGNILGHIQGILFSAIIVELGTMIHWIVWFMKGEPILTDMLNINISGYIQLKFWKVKEYVNLLLSNIPSYVSHTCMWPGLQNWPSECRKALICFLFLFYQLFILLQQNLNHYCRI